MRSAGYVLMCCAALHAQGVITTFAGTGWVFPGNGKPAISAPLGTINGVTVDQAGNPILVDYDDCIVARVSADGILTVLAGNGTCLNSNVVSGDGGLATNASIGPVYSAAYDSLGNLYVGAIGRIRKVTPDGIIAPFAGNGQAGFGGDNGPALSAQVNSVSSIVVDAAGNVFFADTLNNRIRKVTPGGIISTIAGNGNAASSGDGGPAAVAGVYGPTGLAFDRNGSLYFGETASGRVRKITNGVISTVFDKLNLPANIAFDSVGAMYIGAFNVVYKAAPGAAPVLFAGNSVEVGGFSGDGGRALSAIFNGYLLVAPGKSGELYVGDQDNDRMRVIAPGGNVNTIAGNGAYRDSGDGGPPTAATLNRPQNLAIDPAGNIYISEFINLFAQSDTRVRKVMGGIISTFATTRQRVVAVDVRDDCGVPHTTGSVTVSFSDGEPPVALQSLKDGTWQATWQTRSNSLSPVTLNVQAVNPQLQISGARQVDGSFSSQKDPPVLTQGSVGSAASFVPYAALAPGGIISIYGDRLADNTASNQTIPLPAQLGNAQVIIAGQAVPLFYVSQTQVNALVPFGLNANTTHQILVQRGLTYSQPIPIDVGPAQPAPFLIGAKYAIVVAYRGVDSFLVTSQQPATAGDVLVIYCAGLGATDPAVVDGAASPSLPLAQTKAPVTATIGGQGAPVLFAGLTPGLVGLYQVNAQVPAGTPTGDTVPLILAVAGQTGPSSALPVR